MIGNHLRNAERLYGISRTTSLLLVIAPFLILGLFFFFISYPPTQDFAALMTFPNYPIEWVMFLFSLVGGILSCRLAFLLKRQGDPALVWLFYLVFGLGLIWTAGETSAWGQQVIGYRTPHWMEIRNAQDQMTLHNMPIIFGSRDFQRLRRTASLLSNTIKWPQACSRTELRILLATNFASCFGQRQIWSVNIGSES